MRVVRAAVLIHDDAVHTFEPGCVGKLIVGFYADTDQDQIGFVFGSVLASHGSHSVRRTLPAGFERAHLSAAEDSHAVSGVFGLIKRGDLGASDPGEDPIGLFEHGDFQTELAGSRGDFEADVTGADDHQTPTWSKIGADPLYIGDVA